MKKLGMKKVWVPVIALCSVGLIVGTGYAAWTITKNGTGERTGSFIADTVEEENIEVKNLNWYDEDGTTESNGDICFGWDTNYAVKETDWLTNKTKGKEAKMVQVLKFDVISKNSTANVTVSNLELAKETEQDKKNAYTTATAEGNDQRIVPPAILTVTAAGEAVTSPTDGTTTTPYSIKIEFAWGKKFGGNNPIKYYNELKSVDDTVRSNAKTDLETLAKLDGIHFKLTITAAKSGTASK